MLENRSDESLRTMLADYRELEECMEMVGKVRLVSRNWASDILTDVSSRIEYGGEMDPITAREIGWALKRVFGYNDVACLPELVQGFMEATQWYASGELPYDLL